MANFLLISHGFWSRPIFAVVAPERRLPTHGVTIVFTNRALCHLARSRFFEAPEIGHEPARLVEIVLGSLGVRKKCPCHFGAGDRRPLTYSGSPRQHVPFLDARLCVFCVFNGAERQESFIVAHFVVFIFLSVRCDFLLNS